MNKIDLIQTLSTTKGLSKVKAKSIVSLFFDQMAAALEKGDRVEIRGLCSFYVKDYEGYTGRNLKLVRRLRLRRRNCRFLNVERD